MILLTLALLCADNFHLQYAAEHAGLPPERVVAIASVETRCNLSPRVRGRAGEWGRFQIRVSTARRRCPGLNIRRYRGNVACFLVMFGQDVRRFGVTDATVRHNGYGPAGAYAFLYKVLKVEEVR